MPTHFHSTLSDDGVDDDVLLGMDQQRSSSARTTDPTLNNLFQEHAAVHEFSSAQSNNAQLPETVPIPSQLEMLRVGSRETTEAHRRLDYSETCSTARRSSPCRASVADIQWDFDGESANLPHVSVEAEELAARAEEATKSPRGTETQKIKKLGKKGKKPYNTRPRRKISYADGESSSDDGDDSDEPFSPNTRSRAAENAKRISPTNDSVRKHAKESPTKKKTRKSAKTSLPKEKEPTQARTESESPQTAAKRKRQRPKTPLPMDEDTHIVPVPATPPVSDEAPKKRQKRQKKQPAAAKKQPAVAKQPPRNKKQPREASPAAEASVFSLGPDSNLSAQQPLALHRDDMPPGKYIAPEFVVEGGHEEEREDEERESSGSEESDHLTEVTTPTEMPNLRCISNIEVPIASHQPPPKFASLPLYAAPTSPTSPPPGTDEVRDSVESPLPLHTRPFGGLSVLMARNVSRNDEDISNRLQEIHKVGIVSKSSFIC